jgi:hypothetical protein
MPLWWGQKGVRNQGCRQNLCPTDVLVFESSLVESSSLVEERSRSERSEGRGDEDGASAGNVLGTCIEVEKDFAGAKSFTFMTSYLDHDVIPRPYSLTTLPSCEMMIVPDEMIVC